MKKNNLHNKEEIISSSTDTNTAITASLDPKNPAPLTPYQRAQLDALRNLSEDAVRKEAETDPDCEPLA